MLAATVLPLAALFATSVLVQAGSIPGLPECVQGCITDYGGCNQVDVKCICSNQPLLSRLSCCVKQNCDAAGTKDVITFADSLCGSYGVTTLPTAASCASTAATATATASGTRSGTATMSVSSAPAGTGAATYNGTTSHTATGATAASGSQTTAAASATKSAFAVKNYKAEGLGLGMAVLGFLAGL